MCNSAGSATQCSHASLERINWLLACLPIHRWILTSDHPFIDGLVPRIHVDTVDNSSFDDAGGGIPRSGAVPKSTAGSTSLEQDTVPSLDFGEHEERRSIKTRGEHEERGSMRARANGMPIGWKYKRSNPSGSDGRGDQASPRGKRSQSRCRRQTILGI